MRYTRSVPAAVFTLLAAAACGSSDEPIGPQPRNPATNHSPPQARFRTSDDEFARVSRAEVPGFAGFYLQDDGTPVVRLVDPRQRGAAQRYLAQEFIRARSGHHANAPQQPIFKGASYEFARLKDWADGLTPMLERGDVFLIDVDEVENRVSVGVQDAAVIAAVRAEASRLGMPAAALHVETQPRPEQRRTVQDWHYPVMGGIQIAYGDSLCTMGFNAFHPATGRAVFVTNSHCTPTNYGFDGGAFYQNTVTAANHFGNEIADRGHYGCFPGIDLCRFADAAYVAHNGRRDPAPGVVAPAQGVIARTIRVTGMAASTTETADPYYIVARYAGTLPVGTYLEKTGRTSGSTYGRVTRSCVTLPQWVCQDESRIWSTFGDSGSPVFVTIGGNNVQLRGVMWGGPKGDFTTTYSSPLSGIEADLGPLTSLCMPGLGC